MAFSENDIISINEIFEGIKKPGSGHDEKMGERSKVRRILNNHLEHEAPYDSDTMHISYEVLTMLAENYYGMEEYALSDEYYTLALYFVSMIGETAESRVGVEDVFKQAVRARTHEQRDDCEDLIKYVASTIDQKAAKKLIKETRKEKK